VHLFAAVSERGSFIATVSSMALNFKLVMAMAMAFAIGTRCQTQLDSSTDVFIPEDDQELNKEGIQYYRVWVNRGQADAYHVERRYNEFSALYNELTIVLPGQKLFEEAPFPGKVWDTTTFEYRRPALELWLKAVMSKLPDNPQMLQSMLNFLDTVGGEAQAASGVSMPIDETRPCKESALHAAQYHAILVRNDFGETYKIFRRYRQFMKLKEDLGPAAERLPGNVVFPLPDMMPDIGERRKALERWLQEIVRSPNRKHQWKGPVDKFLDREDAKIAYLQCIADLAGAKLEHIIDL
jgi:hypothetical protein